MNPDWSTYVSPANEIRAYMKKVASHFDLNRHISLKTGVEKAEWDEVTKSWRVETDQGEVLNVTHLVSGCGALRRPIVSEFKGLDKFKGKVFHSAQWDQDYDYKGKKVAIIGSGASAVQIAPAIVDQVDQLYVFQRTPNWFFPRIDAKFPLWYKSLLRNVPGVKEFMYWLTFCAVELTMPLWLRKGWCSRYDQHFQSFKNISPGFFLQVITKTLGQVNSDPS
jgi:cation diffusion facilitator CzcD-associated flavoprotein CzcO